MRRAAIRLRSAGLPLAVLAAGCGGATSQTDVASKGGVRSVTQISTTDPNVRAELAAESDMYSSGSRLRRIPCGSSCPTSGTPSSSP